MRALVAVASRHGSTREIASRIAEELRAAGVDFELRDARDVNSVDAYDAVIIGSAIYMGSWMPEARQLVDRLQDQLVTVPVWLFSSGPLGAGEPKPAGDPSQMPHLIEKTHARDHRTLTGKLDRDDLGLGERLIVRMVDAPEGDFRDWNAIDGWAREIATELRSLRDVVGEDLTATAERT